MVDATTEIFDVGVVGRGMFGSATTKHLTERGYRVIAIGPATGVAGGPGNDRSPHRVYSSHDDEGRLTRLQDRDPEWAAVTANALATYRSIEEASGISFHQPVGCLIASRPGGDGRNADPIQYLADHTIDHDYFAAGDTSWSERWPAISFPRSHAVAYEPAPAGLIRPKRLIAAQEAVAARHGALFADDTVVGVSRNWSGTIELTTATGQHHTCRRVVLAAGAFTNFNGLTRQPIDLQLKSEVIVLGQVDAADAAALGGYPTVKYLNDGDDLDAIYMTPPLLYPDGNHYIKMGANTRLDEPMDRLTQVQQWFETATDDVYLPLLQPALQALWPTTSFRSFVTKPCVITYTPNKFPLVSEVEPGIFVAAAGNGGGAKGSDRWGSMAADLVEAAETPAGS